MTTTAPVDTSSAMVRAQSYAAEAKLALPLAKQIAVTSRETSEQAQAMLRLLSTRRAQIEEARTSMTGPINAGLKAINGFFQPTIKAYDATIGQLRQGIGDYALRVERERTLAMVEAAKGAPPPLDPIPAQADTEGVSIRTELRWRVVSPDLVPRELCSPDEHKIQAAIDACSRGQDAMIPGVEWYEHSIVSARKLK